MTEEQFRERQARIVARRFRSSPPPAASISLKRLIDPLGDRFHGVLIVAGLGEDQLVEGSYLRIDASRRECCSGDLGRSHFI